MKRTLSLSGWLAILLIMTAGALQFFHSRGEISARSSVILMTAAALAVLLIINQYYSSSLKHILRKIREARGKTAEKMTPAGMLKSLDSEIEGWMADRRNEFEQMQKLENYRREFLGNVSHELKTPIFNIQGYLDTLLEGGLEDPNINRPYLRKASNSVERMISIVEDLQAISLLEAGELELEIERFDISELTRDICEAQEMRATERKITLTVKNNPLDTYYVSADKQRIRQALTNLITNTIRYGREGGETKIRFSDTGEKILVEVADNGIGIPEKHLPRIFQRFYRVDKGRSREHGGTGLGLAITKHIIEAHRQTINVMSTEGVGSVFTFSLPKAP